MDFNGVDLLILSIVLFVIGWQIGMPSRRWVTSHRYRDSWTNRATYDEHLQVSHPSYHAKKIGRYIMLFALILFAFSWVILLVKSRSTDLWLARLPSARAGNS
ncbi:MAG: hypothetical protein OK457_08535, partial [Thaumarchaeota archaeon]|nr:hypothetical protein [Nitrososphaerota archaeon]